LDSTWITLGILLAGIVVVVGGVLKFRLHAFLALLLAACVVSALTPSDAVKRYALSRDGFPIVNASDYETLKMRSNGELKRTAAAPAVVTVRLKRGQAAPREIVCRAYDADGTPLESEVLVSIKTTGVGMRANGVVDQLAYGVPSELESYGKLETGQLLVPVSSVHAAESLAGQTFAARVTEGFGNTCTKIGVLIALASIIGMCLLESGAADRIVRSTLKRMGEEGAPVSFLTSGFLLGIPVFFDTVFYLMIPLGKALRTRTGRNYLLYVLTIVAGATMAHSLVPPTPGPLFVAEQLGVDLGVMILTGMAIGLFTVVFGYFYAKMANRLWELPLRESPELSLEDLEEITRRDESELPGFWISLLPIVLPVILIGGYTIVKRVAPGLPDNVMNVAAILGDKNVALGISAATALWTLIQQKKSNLKQLAGSIQSALASGGVIILITAAGGAFGAVLKQTGVSGLIQDLPKVSPVMIVGLAFLITTAIRTAQGSATVAMITAVGILSGLATSGDLGFHPVYLAVAIGCGSKPIGWMNDSGFWVITKMSGMTEAEGLKYVTPMTAMMGVVGLVVTMIAVTLFPMV